MSVSHNQGTTRGKSEPTPVRSVGAEIRAVRKARELTLKELSALVGCSIAYLSRIERGDARISVDLLTTLGDALKVDPKWFFPARTGESYNERNYVVRAHERRDLSNLYSRGPHELGFFDELLSSSIAGQLYLMMSRFPPGGEQETASPQQPGFAYEGEQHAVVIQGRIDLLIGEEWIKLNTGDSFSYPTELPHRLRNPGVEEAVVVSAMTPVRITW